MARKGFLKSTPVKSGQRRGVLSGGIIRYAELAVGLMKIEY